MTELEKKANYYEKSLTNDYVENTYIDKLIQQSYKDGYEQGQKDMPLSGQLVHEVERLKKENEELKAINKSLTEENNILVKDLGCETCSIHLEYKNLNNQIEKLKAQIEKMKNCSTCKYKYKDTCYLKIMKNIICKNKDKWELAE